MCEREREVYLCLLGEEGNGDREGQTKTESTHHHLNWEMEAGPLP